MAVLIRGGTIVNHDSSRRADVLVRDGAIAVIGTNLDAPAGAEVIDAGGCYVLPGRDRSAHPSGTRLHGHGHRPTTSSGAPRRRLSGGTTMVVDFCIPNPGQSLLAAYQDWRRKAESAACDYGFHMAVTWWDRQVFDEMETCRQDLRHQHLQALHGLQGRADGQRRRALSLVPPLRRPRRDAAGARRERRRGIPPPAALPGGGSHRPRRPRLFASAGGRGRGHQPRHHDRRHGRMSALCGPYVVPRRARGDRAGARRRQARLRRAADPASRARRGRIPQPGLGPCRAARDVAAVPDQGSPGEPVGRPAVGLAPGGGDRPLRVHHRAEAARPQRLHQDPERHRRPRRPAWRCCGRRASTPGGSPRRNSSP